MSTQSDALADSSAAINPPVRPLAPWRVARVEVIPPFGLSVVFQDGLAGRVDLSQRVVSENAGVFALLADAVMFSKVFLHYGAVTWPCGVDLAPDAMYDAIQQHGIWHLR